jgi:hypothetical protein
MHRQFVLCCRPTAACAGQPNGQARLGRLGARVKDVDPKVFIFGGAIVAIAGFFLIHPYMPDVGPLENAMIGSIPIGNAQLPYRYVLVFATLIIGYGYYRLKSAKDTKPR